jgi:hypothetical protein
MNKVALRMPAEPMLRALEKSLRALYKRRQYIVERLYKRRQYIVERLKERAAISTRAGPAPGTGRLNRVSHSGGGWRGSFLNRVPARSERFRIAQRTCGFCLVLD